MNRTFRFALLAGLVSGATFALPAQAALAIDTGVPTDTSRALAVDGTDWIAGEVAFASPSVIQGIQAYLNDNWGGGSFTLALYGETATGKVGALLQSWSASFGTASGAAGWNGVSGLNYGVAAGKYWVGVEVQGGDSFSGFAPETPPAPLAKYAFNDGSYAGYQPMSASFGLQVSAVPEPASLAMMLAGLGLVAGAGVRRGRLAK